MDKCPPEIISEVLEDWLDISPYTSIGVVDQIMLALEENGYDVVRKFD